MQNTGQRPADSALENLMEAMASGHSEALFTLLEQYREELTRTVRWILSELGRSDAAARAEDLEFMVQTAALVVFDRAGGWRAGAALPWVWASRSIRSELVTWLGHPRVEFDAGVHERVVPGVGGGADVDLRELAQRDQRVAEWISMVAAAANERDQKVHLEYQTQKHLGDQSPAHTVASIFGLSPSNVRQIDTRVRRRVRELQGVNG